MIKNSGKYVDDPNLLNKPQYYAEIHELERSCACISPTSSLSTAMPPGETSDGSNPTSTRKRARQENKAELDDCNNKETESHNAIYCNSRRKWREQNR